MKYSTPRCGLFICKKREKRRRERLKEGWRESVGERETEIVMKV